MIIIEKYYIAKLPLSPFEQLCALYMMQSGRIQSLLKLRIDDNFSALHIPKVAYSIACAFPEEGSARHIVSFWLYKL
jgi:hypothetical protein